MSSVRPRLVYFDLLLTVSQLLAAAFFILTGYFFNTINGGLQWGANAKDNSGRINFHGTFMSYGLVFLQGEALLMFRLLRYDAKLLSKTMHVVFHMLAMSFVGTALYNVIMDKKDGGYPQFTSVHSWIGLGIIAAYLIQFLFGFLNYVLCCVPDRTRAAFLPLHRAAGTIIFGASAGQAVLGGVTYANANGGTPAFACYDSLTCASHLDLIFNFNMVALILFAISVVVLVTPRMWRRQKTPDEEE